MYVAETRSAFRKYGARFVVRGGKSEVVEGKGRSRIVVIEFKDYATALECYRSSEYAKAVEIRKDSAVADIIIAEGYHGTQPTDELTTVLAYGRPGPLYLRKRTCAMQNQMSALCQLRTSVTCN